CRRPPPAARHQSGRDALVGPPRLNTGTPNVRRVAVVTGTRAEYGLLKPVMEDIRQAGFELLVVVTGMHLEPEFGETAREIEADGFEIRARVPMTSARDEPSAMPDSIAKGIGGLVTVFDETDPDVVLLLGDRVEPFAAAIAAAGSNRAVAHIQGGEITRGGLDEKMRHAITKLAHLHFPATEQSRQRIIRMGERPDRVFTVGAPGLDAIRRSPRLSTAELEQRIGAALDPTPLLLV